MRVDRSYYSSSPALLYGSNACPVNATDGNSFDFALFRICEDVFDSFSRIIISTVKNILVSHVKINKINDDNTVLYASFSLKNHCLRSFCRKCNQINQVNK